MAEILEPGLMIDEQSRSLIQAISIARQEADRANFDTESRRLLIVERSDENGDYWSISFLHPNYINRRGGGFEVRVDYLTGNVRSALRTQ